ncbi:hypothetical protein [Saccharopolyspora hattusasensis]|uniref:hypothetical protein n=1 Tax=Saccharopolyspora hattusasensis TaxID=1128679 RepID=UPI003D9845FE
MSILGLMLRATHWPLFAVGCLCLALVNAVLGAEQLPVPVPNVGPIEIPLGLFSPLVMACLIGIHLKPPTQLWDTSPRRHWLIRAGQAFAAFLPALLACTPLLLHSEQLWTAAVRNTVGLGGMILLATGVIGATRSWMLPFPYVLAALLLGSNGNTFVGGRPTHGWWAFVVHDANDIRGVLLAGALLSIGLTVFLRSGPRKEKHS